MAIFDFVKKNELQKISELEAELTRLRQEKDYLQISYQQEINVLKANLSRFAAITDIEKEAQFRKRELDFEIDTLNKQYLEKSQYIQKLNLDYKSALETYKRLGAEIALFESKLNFSEFGVYEPVYDFEKSDDYRNEQRAITDQQKRMIQADIAALCHTQWVVENSAARGKTIVNKFKKLMLRAFNGECDALIAKVKWNNITQSRERIRKIYAAINKLGEGFHVYINSDYLRLKELELTLEYEFHAKKQKEKEEMKAIQDELREEEKARRDFERAQIIAEKEEIAFQKALAQARAEIQTANEAQAEKLRQKIIKLEQELKESQEKKERALSMAQQTKRGYVYVISNIGAFGENIYKIGMTRRLEPMDRVRELGDASVPFQFDVHAMIYSDVARNLEAALHQAFEDRKVNMLNNRKEFFRVTLEEIVETLKKLGFEAEFSQLPEAREYRETLTILEKRRNPEKIETFEERIAKHFPETLI